MKAIAFSMFWISFTLGGTFSVFVSFVSIYSAIVVLLPSILAEPILSRVWNKCFN